MKEKRFCEWQYVDLDDYYKTSCGDAFYFIDGNLSDNRMNFCPYCGLPIKEIENEK